MSATTVKNDSLEVQYTSDQLKTEGARKGTFFDTPAGTKIKVALVATGILALLVGAGLLAYYCPGGAKFWSHVTMPAYKMALIMGSAAITLIVGAILFCKFAVPRIVGDRKGQIIEIDVNPDRNQASAAEKAARGERSEQGLLNIKVPIEPEVRPNFQGLADDLDYETDADLEADPDAREIHEIFD